MEKRLSRYARGLAKVGAAIVALVAASTLWGLVDFWRTKTLYPSVSYPEPAFKPVVNWTETAPKGWIRLSELSRSTWLAVLTAEDGGFFRHNGIEIAQSLNKVRVDLQRGRFPKGVSTLHQQIAKNLYFGARAPITRKFQEAVVARRMDAELSKRQILEIYLNIAEWGPGVVGIGQASRYYFGKSAAKLTVSEAAVLANLLPNPRRWGPAVRQGRLPRGLSRRIQRTLHRMRSAESLVLAR